MFSPDGRTLALGGASVSVEGGCFLTLWDVPNEKVKARLKETAEPAPDWALERQVSALAFSPDGRLLAIAAPDTKLRVFDGQTGAFKNVWEKDSAASIWIAFSPDGKMLASVSRRDKTVKLWDVQTAKVQRILRGNKSWVTAGTFSPDGTLLATGGRLQEGNKLSGEVNVWDAHTGERKYALPNVNVPVFTVAFSPDGKRLAFSGGNEIVTYSEGVVKAHGKTVGEIRLVPLDSLTTKQP
ncbi:MAG TPA: hypothetical protein VKU02_02225 [Gemmataceae bacterium]|nr:hypothetical protein [Gemmataceae bacterium]